jgi:hypothetical protein
MASSPKSRPPPVPTYPLIRHHEARRHVSNRSNHSPKSLYRHDVFQPVAPPPLPSRSDISVITRSFSSGSYQLDNEPDNTTIIRGAKILREQFLQRSHTQQVANSNIRSGKTIEPKLERLFASTNDEVLQDLLGTKLMQPPKSPNDVITGPFLGSEWTHEWAGASDPWSLRGSAFDPRSTSIMTTSSNSRQVATRTADAALWRPTDQGSAPRQQVRDGQALPDPRLQSLRLRPPGGAKPLKQLEPNVTVAKSDIAIAVHGWDSNSSIRTDMDDSNIWTVMDDSNIWANLSVLDMSERTGSYARKEKEAMKVKQTQAGAAVVSDPHARNPHDKRVVSGRAYASAAQRAAEVNAQVFDNFLDSVSLDDQAFEKLIDSKEYDSAGRTARKPESKTKHRDLRDDLIQSSIKRQAMAVTREQAVPVARGSIRGRVQRSYSGGVAQKKMSKRRSHSAGVDRSVYRRQPGMQSSLRDDLLCGMESNCKTEYPTRQGTVSGVDESDEWACHHQTIENANVWDCSQTEPKKNQSLQHQSVRKMKRHNRKGKKKSQAIVFDLQQQIQQQLGANEAEEGLPSLSRTSMQVKSSDDDMFGGVLSPESDEYLSLQATDPAFQHALKAGGLWQSLVGSHVRFPRHWWGGGYRTAPLGCPPQSAGTNKWVYYDRHRVKGNKFLNRFVRKRDEPGQLLLHLVVRDFMTSSPILDIAIGCYHPNAKSVRLTQDPNQRNNDCRDVWMAMRFRTNDMISVIDPVFCSEKMGPPTKSPLGDSKRRISNLNVRSIFGESPPLRTAFVLESDIYEELASPWVVSNTGPADILLQKYVFKRYQPGGQQALF